MTEPQLISQASLDSLSAEARSSARRRKNYNFHAEADPANRLLNAVEPGSYVQPHRHLDPNKDETFVVVRGSFGVVFFDESGAVVQTAVAKAGGEVVGADIPHGVYHSLIALEPGSIFFEAKAGPYLPISDAERAPWAPREGEPAVAAYLEQLERLFR